MSAGLEMDKCDDGDGVTSGVLGFVVNPYSRYVKPEFRCE